MRQRKAAGAALAWAGDKNKGGEKISRAGELTDGAAISIINR
jgi:hypothetical protein